MWFYSITSAAYLRGHLRIADQRQSRQDAIASIAVTPDKPVEGSIVVIVRGWGWHRDFRVFADIATWHVVDGVG